MPILSLAVFGTIAYMAAGCGSGEIAPQTSGVVSRQTSPPGVTLAVRDVVPVGQILVDGTGRTLYAFEADRPDEATCDAACAKVWAPYRISATPRPGDSGVTNAAMVGAVTRADGTRQVTYGGHPMYYFVGDEGPGVANGQGRREFGSRWLVVGPDGNMIEPR
jgi:predicted lipoprotein with Yx(FWY)xxD motif